MATASAIAACTALQHSEGGDDPRDAPRSIPSLKCILKFLLARSMRAQADLVDQLFNSSEKRLARILLLLAEFGEPGKPEPLVPPITQETLAEMIGTTRSRVSFFMNRFRKLGLIEYNGRIRVHKSLLNVVLHDQFTEPNPERPPGSATPRIRSRPLTRGSAVQFNLQGARAEAIGFIPRGSAKPAGNSVGDNRPQHVSRNEQPGNAHWR